MAKTSGANHETRTTIQDVARAAGVAPSTVSRVLNNSDYASASARKRVLSAADQLHFEANPTARGLRRAQTMTIGVLLSDLSNPIYAEFLRGAEHEARKRGYALLIADGEHSAAVQEQMLRNLYARRVDALLLSGPIEPTASLKPFLASGVPIYPTAVTKRGEVRLESRGNEIPAAVAAFQHVVSLGHRRIGFLFRGLGDVGDLRLRLLREVAAEAGLPPASIEVHRVLEGPDCRALTRALCVRRQGPTALIAGSHLLTPYVLLGAADAGLRIPEELSILCFGDSPWAAAHNPPISAVRFDYYNDGLIAVRTLLDQIDGRPGPCEGQTEAQFIVRGSCAPPLPSSA